MAREATEKAISTLHDRFFINEKKLKVLWAKTNLQEAKGKSRGKKEFQATNIEEFEQKGDEECKEGDA